MQNRWIRRFPAHRATPDPWRGSTRPAETQPAIVEERRALLVERGTVLAVNVGAYYGRPITHWAEQPIAEMTAAEIEAALAHCAVSLWALMGVPIPDDVAVDGPPSIKNPGRANDGT